VADDGGRGDFFPVAWREERGRGRKMENVGWNRESGTGGTRGEGTGVEGDEEAETVPL